MHVKPELISPAGDWTSMRAALDAGADAVYFGAEGFNMRAASKSFTPGDFGGIARLCRSHGAKAYLALNSVIYDAELARRETLARGTHVEPLGSKIEGVGSGIESGSHRRPVTGGRDQFRLDMHGGAKSELFVTLVVKI
jgi:hypothetical protein